MLIDDYISGERIQLLCDLFIGDENDFKYNHIINKQDENKKLNINHIQHSFSNPKIIFLYTHYLPKLKNIIQYFQNPFILILHNSDFEFNENYINLIENPKIIHIFSQNSILSNPKLTNLPIGIANSMWNHGNLYFLHLIKMQEKKEKTNLIYLQFSLSTYERRKDILDKLIKKNIQIQPNLEYLKYLNLLSSFKYCICPRGNGIDTHRFWECIYLDVIPICEKSIFTENLKKEYEDIILIDNFEDLNLEELNKIYKYPLFKYPTISDIKNKINNLIQNN